MSYRTPSPPEPVTDEERRSGRVFGGFLILVMLALLFPEMPPQALLGILWAGLGLLMILLPPEEKTPALWKGLAAGFVVFAAAGFLPRSGFQLAGWRMELESLGLPTGPTAFVQPWLAAETLAGFAITALTAIYLTGHRVSSRFHLRLALAFASAVGMWAAIALWRHQPGGLFGFFPNRNHTATLLAMGTLASLGGFARAIQLKHGGKIAMAAVAAAICLYALLVVSISRAGVVLVAVGLLAWILLTGFRHLRGHAGKAVMLVLLGFGGMFLILESQVKSRLTETVEKIEFATTTEEGNDLSFEEGPESSEEPALDGRISIYRDTWSMIRGEPWTGVGPGQFVRVFPQYRNLTTASNELRALHPESDWLMMLAETGWPATLCLAAGVILVFTSAAVSAWRGRARSLRMGTLVAAMLLCTHGLFDVPGHRIGLAWAGIFLLAITLRPRFTHGTAELPKFRLGWRVLGLLPLLAGSGLLYFHSTHQPALPSERIRSTMSEAGKLYALDQKAYQLALGEGRDYQPDPAVDPLEKALELVGTAARLSPLDPYIHYVRGALALHFDDKSELASHSFSIQRKLVPYQIKLVLEQAKAHPAENHAPVPELWREALRRARSEQAKFPKSHFGVANTFQKILQSTGSDPKLQSAALELAKSQRDLLPYWAKSTPAAILDQEMPSLIQNAQEAELQKDLFRLWRARGSKTAVKAFETTHPSFQTIAK